MAGRISATEHTYRTLTERILSGDLPPGAKVDANVIASTAGVSPTPVRNALNRLVGAGLLRSQANEGFFVPACSEHDLRDLYDCSSAMLILALARSTNVQKRAKRAAIRDAAVEAPMEIQTEITFQMIMALAANKILESAFATANIRLRPARMAESECIANQSAELRRIRQAYDGADCSELDLLIDRYHRRRIRLIPKIAEQMRERAGDGAIGFAQS